MTIKTVVSRTHPTNKPEKGKRSLKVISMEATFRHFSYCLSSYSQPSELVLMPGTSYSWCCMLAATIWAHFSELGTYGVS